MKNILLSILLLLSFMLTAQGEEGEKIEWKVATLAPGLFWYLDKEFNLAVGTKDCVTGYANGPKESAYFDLVSSGKAPHLLAIQVTYNPKVLSYKKILEVFWQNINPQDDKGQFIDRGQNYTTAILYHDDEQKKIAEESLKELQEKKIFSKPIVTKIIPFQNFHLAEKRHQDTFSGYKVNSSSYKEYSGRNTFKEKYWKDIIILPKRKAF